MSHTPPSSLAESLSPRPTRMRHLIVAVCVLMSVMLYLDRICVSIAGGYIAEDLSLSEQDMGWFFSAFFWTYALGQVPGGWLSDRWGARVMLTVYILSWSLLTAMMGLAHGFLLLMVMRAGFGFAQAGAYPTSGGILSKWIPFSNRGTASSLVALGGRAGGMLAPLTTAYLIVLFVPISDPSLLTASSLRNANGFCADLLSPPKGTHESDPVGDIRAKLRHDLPPDLHSLIERAAAAQKTWVEQQKQEKETGKKVAGSTAPSMPVADREQLVAALNPVLESPSFFDSDYVHQLSLPKEAVRLGEIAPEHRTKAQTERLNRLVLEAAFPKDIGKLYVRAWRPVMWVYGIVGALVAILFYAVYRNRPRIHPLCNEAECELIESGSPAPVAANAAPVAFPWNALLTSRSMWLMSISQFTTNIGWVLLITSLPRYLDEVHHVPLDKRGAMQSLTLGVSVVALFIGGRLTDWLSRRIGLRWGRGLPMSVTRLFCCAAFAACPFLDSLWAITVALCAVGFFTDLGIGATWAYMQDVGGSYAGSMLGWGNMFGNFGAAIAPPLFAAVLLTYDWNAVFYMCAASFFVSGVTALGIDSTIQIRQEAGPDAAAA